MISQLTIICNAIRRYTTLCKDLHVIQRYSHNTTPFHAIQRILVCHDHRKNLMKVRFYPLFERFKVLVLRELHRRAIFVGHISSYTMNYDPGLLHIENTSERLNIHIASPLPSPAAGEHYFGVESRCTTVDDIDTYIQP